MPTLADVITYLKNDPFKNVVHLKMLDAYADQMSWYGETPAGLGGSISSPAQGGSGVALLLPAAAHPYDARSYPDADWIVLLATAQAEAADRLVAQLPRDKRLVFKLVDELSKAAVLRAFPARRVTGFISYTLQAGEFLCDPRVVVSRELDERLLPLFQSNGYTWPELEHDFSQGSVSFSIFAEAPLSTCYIFKNYERIWEIGGVHTATAHRRQGLAKKVVAAALAELLATGRIPRYQVNEANLSSRAVAEGLGMQPFVVTEHFCYAPE
jgi:hypothetical protein